MQFAIQYLGYDFRVFVLLMEHFLDNPCWSYPRIPNGLQLSKHCKVRIPYVKRNAAL